MAASACGALALAALLLLLLLIAGCRPARRGDRYVPNPWPWYYPKWRGPTFPSRAPLGEGFAWGQWLENSSRENFYTSAALEEPTRSYTPYTGTPNLGYWGTVPWAEAALSPAPLCG